MGSWAPAGGGVSYQPTSVDNSITDYSGTSIDADGSGHDFIIAVEITTDWMYIDNVEIEFINIGPTKNFTVNPELILNDESQGSKLLTQDGFTPRGGDEVIAFNPDIALQGGQYVGLQAEFSNSNANDSQSLSADEVTITANGKSME